MTKRDLRILVFSIILIITAITCGFVAYAHNISAISAQPTPIVRPVAPTIEPTFSITYPTPMPTATPWTVQPVRVHPTPAPVINGNG